MVRYIYIFSLLDTLTFDQHMLFFLEMFNGFSYLALAWYLTLTVSSVVMVINTYGDFHKLSGLDVLWQFNTVGLLACQTQ